MADANMKVRFDGRDVPPTVRRARLRLLVLADLGASGSHGPTLLREAKDLHLLFADLAPRLVLDVPNRLAAHPATFECRLHLRSFKDLAPEALLSRLPALQPATELRRRLVQVREGAALESLRGALDDCAGAVGLEPVLRLCREARAVGPEPAPPTTPEPGPAADEPQDDAVHRIMGLVDLPSTQERAVSAIGKVVGAVAARRRQPRPAGCPPQIGEALEQLEVMIGRQTRALLGHPELQRVEAAWRGLKLLVDRTEFRKEIEIAVMHVERPAVGDPGVEALLADPELDLVLAPWLLQSPAGDAALVQWLAERAEQLQTPLVLSVGAEFFGVAAAEAGAMGYPGSLLERPQYCQWNAVRSKECTRWVAVVFNRFLLGQTAQVPLWGDPVWLVGSLASRSHARLGWPTEIGGRSNQKVEDLPINELRDERGRTVRIPLESLLPHQLVQDLAQAGFMALAARDNSDAAFLPCTPTLFQPPGPGPGPTLPYQLLASRIARAIAACAGQLGGAPAQEVVRRLEQLVRGLIEDTGPGFAVEVKLSQDRAAQLELRTGTAVLGGVAVELAFRLPG